MAEWVGASNSEVSRQSETEGSIVAPLVKELNLIFPEGINDCANMHNGSRGSTRRIALIILVLFNPATGWGS